MTKIAILVILTLGFGMIPAFADLKYVDYIRSPNAQLESGVPINGIQCRDDRVLMQSPSGSPACVFFTSADQLEERGFVWLGCSTCDSHIYYETIPDTVGQKIYADIVDSPTGAVESDWPVVSISNLPAIGETAIVEVTITNERRNLTESDSQYIGLHTGWWITSGFEIVDPDVQYETRHGFRLQPHAYNQTVYVYKEFIPLGIGESHTHSVTVRAVEEGHHSIIGVGYDSSMHLHLHIGHNITLLESDHMDMSPGLHPWPPVRPDVSEGSASPHLSEEEERLMEEQGYVTRGNNTTVTTPTWEESKEAFAEWVRTNGLTIDESVNKMEAFFNSTQIREILVESGFPEEEINAVLTQSAAG